MGSPSFDRPQDDVPLRGRVLVVDDEPMVLAYLERSLLARGHEVVTAADGQVALKALERGGFELVLSDLSMPGLDGVALLREARPHHPDLPFVFITGTPDLASAMSAVELGALRYLTKPVRDADLQAVVQEGLRATRLARRSRKALELLDRAGPSDLERANVVLDETLASLWMAYQPIFPAGGGSVFAYEALCRSRSQVLPHPGAILDAAESLGRLEDVGRSVRHLVARTAQERPDDTFFVNLHVTDLQDPDLFSPEAPLSQVAPRVVLEVTERAALTPIEDIPGRVQRLRDLGYRIALDDLGAGQSGLSFMAQLSPQFVKLDMSMVQQVHLDPFKRRLMESTIRLCHGMGLTVVAEGVEVAEERDAVTALGCNLLQGYLLGRPASAFPRYPLGAEPR